LDAYPRLEQGGIILKWAKQPEAAQALRSFVAGPKGQRILGKYGFFITEG
jgi:molybdate transport system substrate-binding protein